MTTPRRAGSGERYVWRPCPHCGVYRKHIVSWYPNRGRAPSVCPSCQHLKGIVRVQNSRARKLGVEGVIDDGSLRQRLALFGGRCWICGRAPSCWDHVIPLARGGRNVPANLRPACGGCNMHKNASTDYACHAAFRWVTA